MTGWFWHAARAGLASARRRLDRHIRPLLEDTIMVRTPGQPSDQGLQEGDSVPDINPGTRRARFHRDAGARFHRDALHVRHTTIAKGGWPAAVRLLFPAVYPDTKLFNSTRQCVH